MPTRLKVVLHSLLAGLLSVSSVASPNDTAAAPLARTGIQVSEEDTDDPDDEHEFIGRHLIVTYLGCSQEALCNHDGLLRALERAVRASGAHRLHTAEHVFPPYGLTALMLLSESHASIHTYPEHGACFVDLFTCGRSCRAESFDTEMCNYLKPERVSRRVLLRHTDIADDTYGPA